MRYRIVEVTEEGEKYYIIEKKRFLFWKELEFTHFHVFAEPMIEDYVTPMGKQFYIQNEAENAICNIIKDYKTIKYKKVILKPFANYYNYVDYYIEYKNEYNVNKIEIGNIEYLKSFIDKMIPDTTINKKVVKVINN